MVGAGVSGSALAQGYPLKPVHMLVGFVPGGGADIVGRMIAQKLTDELGRPVVVENRPGAGSAIATERVAKAAPDGYTLLMMSASAAILPAMVKLPYDLERDLAPITLVSMGPLVLVVHPSVPARSVKELIALARARPGMMRYASNGAGSPPHLASELFGTMAKLKLVHVPYKGGGDAVIATASGEIDMSFPTVPAAMPLLGTNKFRPLAVTTPRRSSALASVPTLDEAGLPGYQFSNWNGVGTTAGVPRDIIMRLNAAIAKVVNTPEMKKAFNDQGIEPQTNTPEEYAKFLRNEIARNTILIKLSGAKAE